MEELEDSELREAFMGQLDISYSYTLAKKMEQIRSNPCLGYRTAGSWAELETGRMLAEEMRRLGFPEVTKDPVRVDAWEFNRAQLAFVNKDGIKKTVLLGAYQTDFVTEGPALYSLVYAGKGTEADYQDLDVTGKLVLVDINQRDEWWINYPVYQAHLKGAAAVIAVQTGGYGEVDDAALNAQDIAGPPDAPAFSISRRDAKKLKELIASGEGSTQVWLDAETRVKRDQVTYNIVGKIPGRNPERMILLSAHYDSYFDGFQDDNTAVSMMLGIAKALLELGYRPENTLVFAAMAAEEWGVADSQFDWSTGAYEQVFTVHPEWRGRVIADLNFELPALAHGTRARIRSTYEYVSFLERFIENLPVLTQAYPEETRVAAPIETWSDDFSIAIAGIPSMVNDFTGGSFMENNYHSQFDNDSYYDEEVYRFHHELFGLLLLSLDHTAAAPLDFSLVFEKALQALDDGWYEAAGIEGSELCAALKAAGEEGRKAYERVRDINKAYRKALGAGMRSEADKLSASGRQLERTMLQVFQEEQDAFVRIDWYGNVLFPHTVLQEHMKLLTGAVHNLEEGNLSSAFRKLYRMDNNAYAFLFEEEVYRHFTEYVYLQPRERLKWGWNRIIGHENLFGVVKSLLEKNARGDTDYSTEIAHLKEALERQKDLYRKVIQDLEGRVERMRRLLAGEESV